MASGREFERVDLKTKEQLHGAAAFLKIAKRSPVLPHVFARYPARLPRSSCIRSMLLHPQLWCNTGFTMLADFAPANDSERLSWAFSLAQLARRSGQRAIDVDDAHRDKVLSILRSQTVPGHWVKMVEEVAELEADEQSQMFGEALPIGLRLIRSAE
ncbi:MAG: hypothetical protein U0744_15665 [Gemmataceae bacterium]